MKSSPFDAENRRSWAAGAALAFGLVYLGWRTTTGAGVDPLLFWAVLAVEAYGWFRLALHTLVARRSEPHELVPPQVLREVDVVVAAYAEPLDIVRATLIGCREIRYPHETYLVDDRHRPDLEGLAAEMGVNYVARTDTSNGRTGALNHVLAHSRGEFTLLLEADQVPLPDAIHQVIGLFDDERVALVQTPLEYQNRDSVLHAAQDRHERSLTNEIINPGRDRLGAALWEGPAAMLRRSAMADIGGIPTTGSTGELQATVRLQGRGWATRYTPTVIAHGLAAHDLRGYLDERARWARGHLAIVTTRDNPLWVKGLNARQRLSHLELLSGYFAAAVHLVGLVALITTLITAQLPFSTDLAPTAVWFLAWTGAATGARVLLGQGRFQAGETALHSALTFQIHLVAAASALVGIDRRFRAVEGPRTDHGGLDVLRHLSLLAAVTLVLEATIALRLLDSLVGMPLQGRLGGGELVAVTVFASSILWFLLRVLGVFVGRRQYRDSHREPVDIPGVLNDQPVKILDANTSGLSLVTPQVIHPLSEIRVGIQITRTDGSSMELWLDATVRSVVPNRQNTRHRLGCQFTDLADHDRDLLIEYLSIVRPFAELRSSGRARARR